MRFPKCHEAKIQVHESEYKTPFVTPSSVRIASIARKFPFKPFERLKKIPMKGAGEQFLAWDVEMILKSFDKTAAEERRDTIKNIFKTKEDNV